MVSWDTAVTRRLRGHQQANILPAPPHMSMSKCPIKTLEKRRGVAAAWTVLNTSQISGISDPAFPGWRIELRNPHADSDIDVSTLFWIELKRSWRTRRMKWSSGGFCEVAWYSVARIASVRRTHRSRVERSLSRCDATEITSRPIRLDGRQPCRQPLHRIRPYGHECTRYTQWTTANPRSKAEIVALRGALISSRCP
jgi:hypothetical protein